MSQDFLRSFPKPQYPSGSPAATIHSYLAGINSSISSIRKAELRISALLAEEGINVSPGPPNDYLFQISCTTRYLWSSIDCALKALEASIRMQPARLEAAKGEKDVL